MNKLVSDIPTNPVVRMVSGFVIIEDEVEQNQNSKNTIVKAQRPRGTIIYLYNNYLI